MKYGLILTGKLKKGLKLALKRGLDISLLEEIVTKLQDDIPLEEKYRDHELKGNWKGFHQKQNLRLMEQSPGNFHTTLHITGCCRPSEEDQKGSRVQNRW